MLGTVVQIAAYGGPILLALMGVIVVDNRPEGFRGKLAWYAGFLAVAILSVWAAVKAADDDRKETVAMIMGDTNDFPELYGMYRSDGKLELMIANGTDKLPLYDVNFSIARAGTFTSVGSRNWGTLANFAYDTGIAIEQGAYQIDFGAKNGMFVEMLFFGTCDGKITQTRSITKPLEGGRVMQELPDYKHCVGIPEQPTLESLLDGIAIPF